MFRYLQYYIIPFCGVLSLLGMSYGGLWVWVVPVFMIVIIMLLDQLVGAHSDEKPYRFPFILNLSLYTSLPLGLALTFMVIWLAGSGPQDALGYGGWVEQHLGLDILERRNNTAWYHYVLMFASVSITGSAIVGIAGHELSHRTSNAIELFICRFSMALNWGVAFPIEHVYGHHAYVCTTKDPATAARGDSLYTHLPKSLFRTIINAWEIEADRLNKTGHSFWSIHNSLLRYSTIPVAVSLFAYYYCSWTGVMFHILIGLLFKVMLEALNYVEHYGLLRVADQPVQPRHSWNCNHYMSSIFSFNLTRHSHHHADAQCHFENLRTHPEQPYMPGGLLTAIISSFIPPLWRKVSAPKLLQWDAEQADESEYELIRVANNKSGWRELQGSVCNQSVSSS